MPDRRDEESNNGKILSKLRTGGTAVSVVRLSGPAPATGVDAAEEELEMRAERLTDGSPSPSPSLSRGCCTAKAPEDVFLRPLSALLLLAMLWSWVAAMGAAVWGASVASCADGARAGVVVGVLDACFAVPLRDLFPEDLADPPLLILCIGLVQVTGKEGKRR